jgi:hypothetical protein
MKLQIILMIFIAHFNLVGCAIFHKGTALSADMAYSRNLKFSCVNLPKHEEAEPNLRLVISAIEERFDAASESKKCTNSSSSSLNIELKSLGIFPKDPSAFHELSYVISIMTLTIIPGFNNRWEEYEVKFTSQSGDVVARYIIRQDFTNGVFFGFYFFKNSLMINSTTQMARIVADQIINEVNIFQNKQYGNAH